MSGSMGTLVRKSRQRSLFPILLFPASVSDVLLEWLEVGQGWELIEGLHSRKKKAPTKVWVLGETLNGLT